MKNLGLVESVENGAVTISGLDDVAIGDLVYGPGKILVISIGEISRGYLLEGEATVGNKVTASNDKLTINVSEKILGKMIDPMGNLIGSKASGLVGEPRRLFPRIRGMAERRIVKERFHTGISLVDGLLPLVKGQRQLVLGDARSGKTSFLLDVIANQKFHEVICIYGCVGKSIGEVMQIWQTLEKFGATSYSLMVTASAGESTALQYLTPPAAMAVAEWFSGMGHDVVVILDDLGIHAKAYREMSILSGRAPGRESYPGDIFHQQAILVERAGAFGTKGNDGTITLFPVFELGMDDFTTYIPTNLISMTDGQLIFRSDLALSGKRPAIDVPVSVSRIGARGQIDFQKQLAARIRSLISLTDSMMAMANLDSELPKTSQQLLYQRLALDLVLRQEPGEHLTDKEQICLLAVPFTKYVCSGNDFGQETFIQFKKILAKNLGLRRMEKKLFEGRTLDAVIESVDRWLSEG